MTAAGARDPQLEGDKTVIIDPRLSKPLNSVTGVAVFKVRPMRGAAAAARAVTRRSRRRRMV